MQIESIPRAQKSTTDRFYMKAKGAALRILGTVAPEAADRALVELFARPWRGPLPPLPEVAGIAGQRKKIQQGNSQSPFDPIKDSGQDVAFRRRSSQRFESFSPRGSGQLVANAGGKGGEDETHVNISYMVADDQHRSVQVAQVFPTLNARPA